MPTPLLLYVMNEAASGTTPTNVLDSSSGTAVNLPITYTGTSAWTSAGGGRGLTIQGATGGGTWCKSASLSGSKVDTALAGTTKCTLEFVVTASGTPANFEEIGGWNNPGVDDGVTLFRDNANNKLQVWSLLNGDGTQMAESSAGLSAGRHVIHVVIDTTQATAANRVKIYVDGTDVTTSTSAPTQNSTLVVGARFFVLGDDPSHTFGTNMWTGTIWYAALYAAALTAGEVSTNSTALTSNDDANPNATVTVNGAVLNTQRRARGFPPRAPLPGLARLGVGILAPGAITQASFTGTGSAALSSFDASGSGSVTFTGTGSAAASPFALAATGVFAIPAPMAQPGPLANRLLGRPSILPAPPVLQLGRGVLVAGVQTQASFTGIVVAALSPFDASASGLETFTGAGSGALSSFAASGSGAETFSAAGTAALSSFAASGSGSETFTGSGSAAVSPFAVTASGLMTFAATGSAALSSFASSASGAESFTGTANASLASFDSLGYSSPLAISFMPMPGPMGLGFPAKIRLRPLPKLGQGILRPSVSSVIGSGSAALASFDASAAGLVTFIGVGTAAASPFAATGSGAEAFSGTAGAALSSFGASSAGTESFTGTAAAACSPFASTATGTTGNAFNGTASCALSPFAASGGGAETFTGAGSAAASPFACTASGIETFTGSGSAACQPFGAAGSGAQGAVFSGSAGAALSPFGASSSGTEAFSGSASCAASPFAASGAGAELFTGACSSAASPFGASGTGGNLLPITGTASCALAPFGSAGAAFVANPVFGTCTAALSPFNCNAFSGVPFAVALSSLRTSRVFWLDSSARKATITVI